MLARPEQPAKITTTEWLGVSKWDLETPALCVDLDQLNRNIASLERALATTGIASRPHAKAHKCPEISRLQLAAGAIGVCAATVGEAEVFVASGIEPVLLTTPVATPSKIIRAVNLRRASNRFMMVTDTEAKARQISDAAAAADVTVDVLIDVDPGVHRTGVQPGEPALALAQLIDRLPHLVLRGVQCYDGMSQHVHGFAKRRAQVLERMAPVSETVALMARAGLDTGIFTGGGTGTYNIDHQHPGFTDVQCGTYVFMDAQYLAIGSATGSPTYEEFPASLTVVTSIISANTPGHATADAGTKALTCDEPDPLVVGAPDVRYHTRSDEFGMIRYDGPDGRYKPGDRLELIVPHADPVVNLFDRLFVTRAGRVEAIWSIAARGRSQ
ncbi:MAG: DSD1 family PLP-dependent enzyme [Gemmatimonadota bacterium]